MKRKWEYADEEKLTAGLRESNKQAFEAVFHRFYETLYVFVYTRIRSGPLARDVVQETFIRLWMHRQSLIPSRGFKAYLFRIADRLLIDHYRKQSTQLQYQQEGQDDYQADSEDLDLRMTVQTLVHDLPATLREVFILSRYQGYTYAEIAERLNISVKTVESRMGKALKTLRRNFTK